MEVIDTVDLQTIRQIAEQKCGPKQKVAVGFARQFRRGQTVFDLLETVEIGPEVPDSADVNGQPDGQGDGNEGRSRQKRAVAFLLNEQNRVHHGQCNL